MPVWGGPFDEDDYYLDKDSSGYITPVFPRADSSVENGISEGVISVNDVSEAVLSFYHDAAKELQQKYTFYRNYENRFLLFTCETRECVLDILDSTDEKRFEMVKPLLSFFPSVENALKFISNQDPDGIGFLSKDYFLQP